MDPLQSLFKKFRSLLLVSIIIIAISSSPLLLLLVDNSLFAEALDSPTAPYTTTGATTTTSPNDNPDESQSSSSTLKNNEQLATETEAEAEAATTTVVDKRAETIIQTINTSEEDAINLRENVQTYEDDNDNNSNNNNREDDASQYYNYYPYYEPKAQKQKQRQKQRQIRKQQQQQLQHDSSSDQHHMLRDATLPDSDIEQEVPLEAQEEKNNHIVNEKQQPPQSQTQQPQQQQQQQQHSTQAENEAYMHWCEKVLGIQSVVEIKEFEYIDHLQIHWGEKKNDPNNDDSTLFGEEGFQWLKQYTTTTTPTTTGGEEDDTTAIAQDELVLPTKLVRGIAAKHAIAIGDIVISIPLYSLLSVPTTIDHDPVLSRILGPTARQRMDWTRSSTAEYEIALLVIAVLYHRSLGSDSPLSHYIEILMGATPTTMIDSFPFLWSEKELQSKAVGDAGVQTLARGIRQDLYEMYDKVMGSLVKERPEIFAPPEGYRINSNNNPAGGDAGGSSSSSAVEWSYSYEKFQWAFALVISRHHYLPIQDFDEEDYSKATASASSAARPIEIPAVAEADNIPSQNQETLSTVSELAPPANQPTNSWVDMAKNEEHVTEDDYLVQETGTTDDDNDDDDITTNIQSVPMRHSFLAPLADLINFGPPCLTGSYNAEEHVFELIATCPFTKGQEVTFFYSSDCSDVIIANFGFLHPLVPPCDVPPSQEEWERKSEEWDEKTKMWEKELWEVYQKQDLLKDGLTVLESQLVSCECEDGERKDDAKQQQQQVYSMPTESSSAGAEVNNNKKPQHHHSLRQDSNFGVRGRVNEPDYATKEMMEELG